MYFPFYQRVRKIEKTKVNYYQMIKILFSFLFFVSLSFVSVYYVALVLMFVCKLPS